jgi:hypothetical protein
LSARLHLLLAGRGCGHWTHPLPRDAASYANPDPKYPSDVLRLHSVYDGSSDRAYSAFITRRSWLPADRIRSKVSKNRAFDPAQAFALAAASGGTP